jgi:hypothetical protein
MYENNVIVLLVVLFILFFFYNLYKAKLERDDINFSYQQIKDFLNDTNRENKPILWIYLKYEKNSRNWESFYSPNSFDLNQGYLYLTVRSIIEHCKKSFHICLIDDNVFSKLLDDGYLKHLNKKAVPNKDYLRICGMCELLYTYGGIFVPSSFICFTNLHQLLEEDNKMFVGEFVDRTMTTQKTYFSPSYQLMGCRQSNNVMHQMIKYMKKELITDFTEEPKFVGKLNIWLNIHVKEGEIRLVDGSQIGTKTKSGIPLNVENLMSTNYADLYYRLGIYIPEEELLQRIQYGWFIRMSPKQVLEANIYISKMLLLANSETERTTTNHQMEFFQIK